MVILSSAVVKVRAKTLFFCHVPLLMSKSTRSLDRNVYIWHRENAILLGVLTGHGEGSVNAVAWNPTNERMFASCSDDLSIRIWEPAPSLSHPFVEKGKDETLQRLDSSGVNPAYLAQL